MSEPLIVDFHAYIGRDSFGDYSQNAEELVAIMDAYGIDKAVISPLVDFPGPFSDTHEIIYRACKDHPDRYFPFARLDPRYGEQTVGELILCIEKLGFKGLLFDPVSTNTAPNHPGVLPMMKTAADYHLPVLIKTGNSYFGLPEQAAWLAQKLPGLKIVLGHMGTAPHATRSIDLVARYENLYLETSLQQSPYRIPLAVENGCVEKVLFGSASPYGHPYPEMEKIKVASISSEHQSLILGENAKKLLNF